MRVNGVADNGLLTVGECYANCPKYLQKRIGSVDADGVFAPVPVPSPTGDSLTATQIAAIRAADTLFIATRNGDVSADASHRGGNPGFVRVSDTDTLSWLDYPGNAMFNTLGNLETDDRAGLFFPDFATGDALLVSGTAETVWRTSDEQIVVFTVRVAAALRDAFAPFATGVVEYSPFNPVESHASSNG